MHGFVGGVQKPSFGVQEDIIFFWNQNIDLKKIQTSLKQISLINPFVGAPGKPLVEPPGGQDRELLQPTERTHKIDEKSITDGSLWARISKLQSRSKAQGQQEVSTKSQ